MPLTGALTYCESVGQEGGVRFTSIVAVAILALFATGSGAGAQVDPVATPETEATPTTASTATSEPDVRFDDVIVVVRSLTPAGEAIMFRDTPDRTGR